MRRKQAQLNQIQISNIANQIMGIRRTCKDPALLKRLDALYEKTVSLPGADSADVVQIDVHILSDISRLNMAIQKGNKTTVEQLFQSIDARLSERSVICFQSIPLPLTKKDRKMFIKLEKQNRKAEKKLERMLKKNKGSVEEIRLRISELTDENARLKEECFALFEVLQGAFDPVTDTELKTKDALMKSNERKIKAYLAALKRKSADDFTLEEERIYKETSKFAPITSEELRVRAKKLGEMESRIDRESEEIDEIMQGGHRETEAARSAVSSPATTAAPATPVAPVETNPYAGKQNPYGASAAVRQGKVEEYFEDVDEQVMLLDSAIAEVGKAIQKKRDALSALTEEIRQMLVTRKTASAAECVILDGDIDSKYSEYSTAKSGIERLNQERAKYIMERNIISQIRDIRDASERNSRIAEMSGGRFVDIASLATAVSEDTARKNDIIAEARDAVAVANATSIDSMTFAEAGVVYDTGVKDEDKYAGLEKEFGVR